MNLVGLITAIICTVEDVFKYSSTATKLQIKSAITLPHSLQREPSYLNWRSNFLGGETDVQNQVRAGFFSDQSPAVFFIFIFESSLAVFFKSLMMGRWNGVEKLIYKAYS